jgi:hypothetical protein
MFSVCVTPLLNFNALISIYEAHMSIIAAEFVSTTYFINPSHWSVSPYIYPFSLLGNG